MFDRDVVRKCIWIGSATARRMTERSGCVARCCGLGSKSLDTEAIMKRHGRPARLKAERPLRTVSSPEGTISFTLLSRHQTLYVERESIDPSGCRRIVAAALRQPDDFVRWCEADQARFASPLTYSRARKAGLDILSRIPAPTRPS